MNIYSDMDKPPAYTGSESATSPDSKAYTNGSPPPYVCSKSYKIGNHPTRPLVDTYQLKLHLRLLQAFYCLRTSVQNIDASQLRACAEKLDASQRWTWFLHLAVERFERWVLTLPEPSCIPPESPAWFDSHVPPLDVLLIWHSYMLHPSWYAEDCSRMHEVSALPRSLKTPLQLVARMGTGSPLTFKLSAVRMNAWLESTWTPFDPLEAMTRLTHKTVVCQNCLARLPTSFLGEDGTGYAQSGFRVTCEHCSFEVTREKLGVAKFARDLARVHRPADGGTDLWACMAGTVHMPFSATNTVRATLVKDAYLHSPNIVALNLNTMSEIPRGKTIQMAAGYSFTGLEKLLSGGAKLSLAVGQHLRPRVMSAYVDDRIFSVELVSAVLRQDSFVESMHNLGWTDTSYFSSKEGEAALQNAVERYHAFLDLMANSPSDSFIATLDIDLAWHTHQLYADVYAADCKKHLGRYLDHDEQIEEKRFSAAFEVTCRAWKSHFGMPYAYCGCSLPGDTIRTSSNGFDLVPPENKVVCATTHPSDHNGSCGECAILYRMLSCPVELCSSTSGSSKLDDESILSCRGAKV